MNQTHALTQGIASLGRGPDTTLVHMSQPEVDALQKLAMAHGGSLTINPKTGLPEAGFLSSILPMAIGLGANVMFPGLGAMGTALLTGGLTAGLSGNLQKGLLAGIGSYGVSGIGDALAKSGAEAAVTNPAATAGSVITPSLPDFPTTPQMPAWHTLPDDVGNPMQATSVDAVAPTTQGIPNLQFPPSNPTMFGSQRLGDIAVGAQQDGALKNAVLSKNGLMAGMGLLPLATDMMSSGNNKGLPAYAMGTSSYSPMGAYNKDYRPANYNPNGENNFFPGDRYVRTAAGGGLMGMSAGGAYPQDTPNYPLAGIGSQYAQSVGPTPSEMIGGSGDVSINRFGEEAKRMNSGGLASLHTYKAGGLLNGPGDGVSDSIPAVINGPKPQRAALADGEFVIPARIVSEIGNGSTKAGSKRLYDMMDRIEKARKRVKNGKDSGAHRMLPA